MTRTILLTMLLCLWAAGPGRAQNSELAPRRKAPGPDPFDAVFVNTNQVRLMLQVDGIEVETPYGKLRVPVNDIYAIDFGMRVPEGTTEKIAAALADLAARDEGERRRAADALVELGPYSYRAVLRASQANDEGMRARAQEILQRLSRKFSAPKLSRSTDDVIVTPQMKIVGRICASSLKANVEYFGKNDLQIASLVSLRNTNVVKPITDLDRIQGTWLVTQFDFGGFPDVVDMSFTFVKDQVIMGGERRFVEPGSFKLGKLDNNVRTIDLEVDGEPMIGIYQIEGNLMKMCLVPTNRGRFGGGFGGGGAPERPTDFVSPPGSDTLLIVLEKRSPNE